MKYIQTVNAPKAVGPYSQAIVSNGFVFCSGQIGIDPINNELVQGLEAQAHQVLKNLIEVLKAGDSSLKFTEVISQITNLHVRLLRFLIYPKMH